MARTPKKRKIQIDKKKAWKIAKWTVIACVLAAVIFAVWILATTDLSIGDSMSTLNLKLSSVIYWQDDETGEWEEFEYLSSDGNRIWTDIDDIPNYLEDAFIAIEDQRFMSHRGVDWKRTIGATFNEVFKGGSTYGGSSITQQLVKNLTGERDRSYTRKIKEILRALSLETKFSKQQILEFYLNSIYLGHGCNGVEAAAQTYFNKSVSELTLAESASIAGITQYPSLYDPFVNKEKNIEKQRTILKKMLELEFITEEDYDEAIAEELKFEKGDAVKNTSQSYFVDQVVEEVIADLMKEYEYTESIATQMVYNGGLKIYATVNKTAQDRAEEIFENESNFPNGSGSEKPQAAMVITDPETGYVKAIVGGRGEKTLSRGLNRATQTTRQPGSTIKPLSVYGPAIDLGLITPDSTVQDEPIDIAGWAPKNHYDGFYGDMTVRRAVNISANIPAVKVLQKVTIQKSFDYMTKKMNFSTLVNSEKREGKVFSDKNLPALALGGLTDGVTVMEMCAGYASFANGGMYIEPVTYTKVEDNIGKTVLVNQQEKHTAFKATTAYQMNQLLKGVVTSGTAAGSSISRMETAGKTGTTDNDTDRWFVGYTPHYVGVVWVGYDSSRQLPSLSANPALSLWRKVMPKIHEDLDGLSFTRPAGLQSASVCYETGLLSTEDCIDEEGNSTAVVRYYDKANMPTEYCDGTHGKEETDENAEGEETEGETGEGESSGEEGSITPPREPSGPVEEAPPENIIE